ncbi:MAG: 4-hydroxythreonine-4-phosphate dehydrogenase PdxA [Defluviicoccus sp.]|nr:4-hydroxythreonine-4-phosphate dehydrogenase PdxA [Defluviicoccus sp.]MDE0274997.1 4-hydroxythreonine-4-phosphate dehydrogenase PdxA [Defluviicoccus sp.]
MRAIALTMGDSAGIGPEIALETWVRRREAAVPPFVYLGGRDHVDALAATLGLNVPVETVSGPAEAADVFMDSFPVLPIALSAPVVCGKPDPSNGPATIEAIDRAVELAGSGEAAAVVTNPIGKAVLYRCGFRHPGHTEYLADLCGSVSPPAMMLVCDTLRVVPVTVHLPLAEAAKALTVDAIVHCGRTAAAGLARDFGIRAPRLAVAGLNPHAGESGHLGREEIEIVEPAIDILRRDGIQVEGPSPADTLFHEGARRDYDAALCMYHDQALIPIKTLDFFGGVNVTLGLPIVRTSPDHGTGYDIAGKGAARPDSLIAALRLAATMAGTRAGTPDALA